MDLNVSQSYDVMTRHKHTINTLALLNPKYFGYFSAPFGYFSHQSIFITLFCRLFAKKSCFLLNFSKLFINYIFYLSFNLKPIESE
jgi:hypothetical protein